MRGDGEIIFDAFQVRDAGGVSAAEMAASFLEAEQVEAVIRADAPQYAATEFARSIETWGPRPLLWPTRSPGIRMPLSLSRTSALAAYLLTSCSALISHGVAPKTATVVKAEAAGKINTLDHAEMYAPKLWEVRNQLITVNEQVLQLNRKVQELETDSDIERGQLNLRQQEWVELSRLLVLAQEAKEKWRLAALAGAEYLLCLTEKREDVDFYRTTAEMRLQEAYRFSEARAAAARKKEELIGAALPIDVKGKGESVGSDAHVLVRVVTPAVAKRIVEKLPDAERDTLYTAVTTEQLRRKPAQAGQPK